MKKSFLLASLLLVSCAHQTPIHAQVKEKDLNSPFESSHPIIKIPNTHLLDVAPGEVDDRPGRVIRGQQPKAQVKQLVEAGVTDVLIFKDQKQTEVDDEIAALKDLGFHKGDEGYPDNIYHKSFLWKGFKDVKAACVQTLEALELIRTVKNSEGRTIFFHCTVGEDRTGYLAGLYRMLIGKWSAERAFKEEMCPRGYGYGDPNKPEHVSADIQKELTPLFLKMVGFIQSGRVTEENLSDVSVCDDVGDLVVTEETDRWRCEKQVLPVKK